jgi:DNA repair protein RecN (Recombination protein N)
MLRELRMGNLALVDEVAVPLGPGLTVLTGETGAGKSLVAGAMALLCGRRADKELVRQGEECGWVEGLFDLGEAPEQHRRLGRLGVRVAADGMLVLRREIRRAGRSRVLVNGLVSSLALLEQAGPLLLAIQSQDQQRELSDPGFVRGLLDGMLSEAGLPDAARAAWRVYRELQEELAARREEDALAREQMDIWAYQHEELNAAGLRIGEEEELSEALVLKRHASRLQEAAAAALERVSEGPRPARDLVGEAVASLRPVADKSRGLGEVLEQLLAAEDALGEAARSLDGFLDRLDLDPGGLEEMEARLALYSELQRKYRRDVPGLLALRESLAGRLSRQEAAAHDLAALQERLDAARTECEEACTRLHAARADAAPRLAERALELIRPLSLPDLELRCEVRLREDPEGPLTVAGRRCAGGPEGADRVELRIRPNPGESWGSAAAIASGGERSRLHLGLTLLGRSGPAPPLMLFDEVDAGLGMDAAAPVARLLRRLARVGQVVVITHLPTMAVYGRAHLHVQKRVVRGRTLLDVAPLDEDERVAEVARLLGGEGYGGDDRQAQRAYALELLEAGGAGGGKKPG